MSSPQFASRETRPRQHLIAAGKLYPKAWADMDHMRRDLRGQAAPDWPQWCFIPIAGAQAAVANDAGIDVALLSALHPDRLADAARLAALAAWRMTQGIYRFDPAIYEAVSQTPVAGDIPDQVFDQLPEWCIYIETPELATHGLTVHGTFAHLEWDVNVQRRELRLLMDCDEGLVPLPVHLGSWSLSEAIDRALTTASVASLARGGRALPGSGAADLRPVVEPIVSLLLYVCSQAGQITGRGGAPGNPVPVRTRRDGWKLFPAEGPRTWEVGTRLGAALRAAYAAEQTGSGGSHAGPRPHVRRAHWHTFLSGPRLNAEGTPLPSTERRAELRWLPPIAVNLADAGDLPATVRPVR
ncbi:hypothetical protein AACH06_25665 [Ideonella sp. DXS29W]|uniref:DUF3396 domain-containing protein n=1 Tax=Ideonella lacteola TaxID=2984193 RepID=A0ABU9BYP0_9BURK